MGRAVAPDLDLPGDILGGLLAYPDQRIVRPTERRIDVRDGAAIKDVAVVRITAIEDSELVMVDVP